MMLSVFKFVVGLLLFTAIAAKTRSRLPHWRPISYCKVQKGFLLMQRDECWFQIETFGCRGGCLSSAKPFSHGSGFASSCSCCAPIKSTIKEKTVTCRGGTKVISYPEAKVCACRPCLDGS